MVKQFFTPETDGFKQDWEKWKPLWLNPPFSLWGKVLHWIGHCVCAIVVYPEWPQNWWFHTLQRLCVKKLRFAGPIYCDIVSRELRAAPYWASWVGLLQPAERVLGSRGGVLYETPSGSKSEEREFHNHNSQ